MRPWRGGGRSGRGFPVLFEGARHPGKRRAPPSAPCLPGRRRRRHRQYRLARNGPRHGQPGLGQGDGMTAPAKIISAFDVEKARADFPILSRTVYGKKLVYLDSGASAQKPEAVLAAMTR